LNPEQMNGYDRQKWKNMSPIVSEITAGLVLKEARARLEVQHAY